jgi:hypothetical protein
VKAREARVSVTKLSETKKAYRVIYHHFENPAEFAMVYLPKSVTVTGSPGVCWTIPMWLKNKIAEEARRYRGEKFRRPTGVEDYLYGFGEERYDSSGFKYRRDGGGWKRVTR